MSEHNEFSQEEEPADSDNHQALIAKLKTEHPTLGYRKLAELSGGVVDRHQVRRALDRLKIAGAVPSPGTLDLLGIETRALTLDVLIWDTDQISRDKVNSISASFSETGRQISNIQVRPDGTSFRVVAGRHRCEAAKALQWATLRADVLPYVTDQDKLRAELIEVDENLCRKSLSPAQEAALTARRKAIYERLYPETRHGVAGGKARHGATSDKLSFAESQAKATGKTERTVQRATARAEALGHETLTALQGTQLDKGDELDALAKLPPERRAEVVEKVAAGEHVSAKAALKQVTRKAREVELGEKQNALPEKRYGVILADPEWKFEVWGEGGMDRAADNHYPTSVLGKIQARDVASIAADDCVLFLWATVPMLPAALAVMATWGFQYASHIAWDKEIAGTGYWSRNRHELMLIGTRGNVPAPAPGTQCDSVIVEKRGRHSAKPKKAIESSKRISPICRRSS